jgi:hypothetical protein
MTAGSKPHASNVPGPFYVVDGCCTTCGVPEMASRNFQFGPDGHCYVSKQPDQSELDQVLRVVRTQELGCIRYRGSDLVVLRRLAEAGESAQCDAPPSSEFTPILRNFVSFFSSAPNSLDLLAQLRADLLAQLHSGRATDVHGDILHATCKLAWFADDFHAIDLRREQSSGQFTLNHTGPLSLSEMIDDILQPGPYDRVLWYSSSSGENGASRPW